MSSVKVAVRVRPFNQREIDLKCQSIIQMSDRKTIIANPRDKDEVKEFTFDHSYWSFQPNDANFASQSLIFNDLGEGIVDDALEGYNSCIFAYGQTGSGKTHTMMGDAEFEGLIPRICQRLFDKMESLQNNDNKVSYKTEISYLEIYNEQVRDLLCGDDVHSKMSLKVREHPKLGPYVEKLSKHLVYRYEDIFQLMLEGNIKRTTASTNMNNTSSRSHAIFTISFSKASYVANNPYETVSKINLVDLAGSERANATKAEGQRLVEGSHINKSLVTLGNVISSLAEKGMKKSKKICFIPYRDSTLTWLLKDSLGGNSKTIMVATISPANVNYAETLNTLRYANRAKNILNKPEINEDPNTKLIRELRTEIERLTKMINQSPQISEQLEVNEAKVKELTKEWIGKWDEIKNILSEKECIAIRKSGNTGVVLDSDRPHLIVCVDDDVLSTGVTLFQLNEGNTCIGTRCAKSKQHIVINNGTDVEDEHCRLFWDTDTNIVTLHPINNSLCFVNNSQVTGATTLHQGCIIVLGENNMFRFSNPIQVKNLKEKSQDINPSEISTLNRTHLTGSTSYDSMYNSISSLNNKKSLVTSFASTLGLNCQEGDPDEKSEENTFSDVSILQKLKNVYTDLEFIKVFLRELRGFMFEDNQNGKDFSEVILNILVKICKEKNISKQTIVQIISLINKSEPNETNEKILSKVIEYLQNKLNSSKDKLKIRSDFINNNDNEMEVNGIKASLSSSSSSQENATAIADRLHSNLTNEEFTIFISSQLNHLSKDVELQLFILKDFLFKQNVSSEYYNSSELNSTTYGSPANILDELIEAEVQRRMDIHLQSCSLVKLDESSCLFGTKQDSFDSELSGIMNLNLNDRFGFEWEEMDEVLIYVPSFHLQSQPDEHFVYEVKISINGDRWTIYRRYRCFLQLHKHLQHRFGSQVQLPYFPPKKWFNNKDLKAIELRRRFLENYLQKSIDICKNLSNSPLNFRKSGYEHLNRICLYEFADFFKVNRLSDN